MVVNHKGFSLNFDENTGTTLVIKDGNILFCTASDVDFSNDTLIDGKTNNSIKKAQIRIDHNMTDKAEWMALSFPQQKEFLTSNGLN